MPPLKIVWPAALVVFGLAIAWWGETRMNFSEEKAPFFSLSALLIAGGLFGFGRLLWLAWVGSGEETDQSSRRDAADDSSSDVSSWDDPRGIPAVSSTPQAIAGFAWGALMASMVVAVGVPEMVVAPSLVRLANWIVGLAGLGLAGRAVWLWRLDSAGGNGEAAARFLPDENPLPRGGWLTGTVLVPHRVRLGSVTRVSVCCQRTSIFSRVNEADDRGTRVINDVVERVFAPTDWEITRGGARLKLRLPLNGGADTTRADDTEATAQVEWLLTVKVPASSGEQSYTFSLPVFAAVGVEAEPPPPPLLSTAERSKQLMAEIVAPPPVLASVSDDALRVAGAAALGAKGVVAEVFELDLAGIEATRGTPWIAAILGSVFLMVIGGCGLMLGAVPYAGPTLVVLDIVVTLGLIGSLFYGAMVESGPPTRRLWVENDGIVAERTDGRRVHFARAELGRFEVRWTSTVGTRQTFSLVAASRLGPGQAVRKRRVMVQTIFSREATQAVAQWLAARLSEPRPEMVNGEGGAGLFEWFDYWFKGGRKSSLSDQKAE